MNKIMIFTMGTLFIIATSIKYDFKPIDYFIVVPIESIIFFIAWSIDDILKGIKK